MHRMSIKFICLSSLDHCSEVHNNYTVRNIFYDTKVMRDKQVSQSSFFLQFFQHIDNLCLDRHIKSWNRLITDDEFRINRKSTCDTDTLSLSTWEFVWETWHMIFIKTNCSKQLLYFCILCWHSMLFQTFSNDILNSHTWIQWWIRVLENHLYLLTEFFLLCMIVFENIFSIIIYISRSRIV